MDSVFVELVAQGPNADAQQLGGMGAVADGLVHGCKYMALFKFGERQQILGMGAGTAPEKQKRQRSKAGAAVIDALAAKRRKTEVLRLKQAAVAAENDSAFDDVLQFADVARPMVALKDWPGMRSEMPRTAARRACGQTGA